MDSGVPGRAIWTHTVGMLDGGNRRSDHSSSSATVGGQSRHPDGASSAPTVRILGRKSDSTIYVSWRDPTACHYGDQMWKLRIAKVPGTCALSHCTIHVGDLVYRPIHARLQSKPVNRHFMILASAVEHTRIQDL
ncbi:DUF3331 domain-containing protein [Burkholderia cepacia]|uniref:DUF3331 domain-containing protein n=1 Tax=Burkholderia cepacia TaxID=292 RepID=UPI0009BF808B|nr:DUF3331 domain-containing protein [Burkholderia cepacia]